MRHSISYYLELPEYGSPDEIKAFEEFLDAMCWSYEDFIAYLEWEEVSNEIIEEEEISLRELFEDIQADEVLNYQKENHYE